jgi:hypothetical protein
MARKRPGDLRIPRFDRFGAKLFPAPGPARWKALTQEALADGILDATQPRRRELTLPQDEGRKAYIALGYLPDF